MVQGIKKMGHRSYKDLIVYQKSKQLTLLTLNLCNSKKYEFKYNFLVDQLLRSTSSIGANIAEGYGRYYSKNYRQFLSIARGSSFETDYWLEVVLELGIFNSQKVTECIKMNIEISKMLTKLMQNLQ